MRAQSSSFVLVATLLAACGASEGHPKSAGSETASAASAAPAAASVASTTSTPTGTTTPTPTGTTTSTPTGTTTPTPTGTTTTTPTGTSTPSSTGTTTPTPTGTSTPSSTGTSTPTGTAPSNAAAGLSDPAAKSPPKKIAARHILIQWMGCQNAAASVVRTRDQARTVATDVLRRVKAGEDFARLVVDYSDEPNAGARGGSLGRFGHGAMVKEFEDAAFALKPGEVSSIVESPFGFHVIQRTE